VTRNRQKRGPRDRPLPVGVGITGLSSSATTLVCDERVVTTLIREWGTRSGLQAVLQVGGQTNFGPSAEALLTQFRVGTEP
jgi:hypothetical protein